ncbi:MAG: hypothetical protein K8J08_02685 [Thermoanaerobaculia bacterium]|nr:hypothetical protein [Thermoanaerobaculia bacterium]
MTVGEVHRHHDGSETESREVGDHELRAVAEEKGDAITGLDAVGRESVGERFDSRPQFLVRPLDLGVAVDPLEGVRLRVASPGNGEEIVEIQ